MAPRKRTTNKKQKNDPKTAKLEAFLADFDGEGKLFPLANTTFVNGLKFTFSRNKSRICDAFKFDHLL